MFPNQQEQESWVPSSEYCGNYSGSKLTTCPPVNEGSSWYNWAQSSRSYSDNLWKHMGTSKQGSTTSTADYQINSSCFMSNEDKKIKEEVLDFIPRSKKCEPKLGINSNVYKMYSSLYQNTQRKQFLAQNCVNRYNMKPGVITTSIFGNIPMSKYSTEDIPSNYLENSECTSKEYSQKPLPNEPLHSYSDMQESPELPENFNRSEQTLFVEPDSSTDLETQTSNEQLSENYQDKKKLKKKSSQENENYQTDIMDANSTFEDSTDTEDFFGNVDDDYDDDDDFEDEDDFGMGTNESILLPSSNEDECTSEEMTVKVKMEQDPMVSNYKPKLLNPKKTEIPKALKWENSNKKMVNKGFRSALPLEVQLQEYNQPSRYIPRNFFNNSIMQDESRPKKRGRKPKHYSDILYELGQRGTSVTMTSTMKKNSPSSQQQTLPSCAKLGSGQQLKCPHCNKILTTSVGLMYHIRLHTGEKPYSCDLCGKSFATSSHYHYHIRTHSGGKPYRCDLCGKMYTASGSLRLHLKTHLSQLSDRALMTNMFPVDPLMVRENDLPKIKQEILDPENFEVQQ